MLTQNQAADRIRGMTDDEFSEIARLSHQLQTGFDWKFIRKTVNVNSIRRSLQTCALLIAEHAGNEEGWQSADSASVISSAQCLGEITDENDDNKFLLKLAGWERTNARLTIGMTISTRLYTFCVIAMRIARFTRH
jgi:hypothetical protein